MSSCRKIIRNSIEEEKNDHRVSMLKVLADPVRLETIPAIGKAQLAISKHLDILYQAGILNRRVEGKRTLYRIKDQKSSNVFRLPVQNMRNTVFPLYSYRDTLTMAFSYVRCNKRCIFNLWCNNK